MYDKISSIIQSHCLHHLTKDPGFIYAWNWNKQQKIVFWKHISSSFVQVNSTCNTLNTSSPSEHPHNTSNKQ